MSVEQRMALDELVDYCPFVIAAWNQYQEAEGETDEEALQRVYRQRRTRLEDHFKEAQRAGIDYGRLTRILIDRLPTALLEELGQPISSLTG